MPKFVERFIKKHKKEKNDKKKHIKNKCSAKTKLFFCILFDAEN